MRVATNVSLVRGAEGREGKVGEGCLCACLVLGLRKKSEVRVPRFQRGTLPHPGEGVLSVPPCMAVL